jgi:hypothetical protein
MQHPVIGCAALAAVDNRHGQGDDEAGDWCVFVMIVVLPGFVVGNTIVCL